MSKMDRVVFEIDEIGNKDNNNNKKGVGTYRVASPKKNSVTC